MPNHIIKLIIGGVVAGMSAALQARRVNENISIGVFEKSDYVSYGACGMPYAIDNLVADFNKLIAINKNIYISDRSGTRFWWLPGTLFCGSNFHINSLK